MVHCLSTLAALPKNQGLIPRTHMKSHNHLYLYSKGISIFYPPQAPHTHMLHIHTRAGKIPLYINKKKKRFANMRMRCILVMVCACQGEALSSFSSTCPLPSINLPKILDSKFYYVFPTRKNK